MNNKAGVTNILNEQMQEIIRDTINQYCYENKQLKGEVKINLDNFLIRENDLFVIIKHNDFVFATVLFFDNQYIVTSYDSKLVFDGKSKNNSN